MEQIKRFNWFGVGSILYMLFLGIMVWLITATTVFSQTQPILETITYEIEPGRKAMGKATPIADGIWLSADHVVRDTVSNLGNVIATDRKRDWCLIAGPTPSHSELRRTPLRAGETLYFQGGTLTVKADGTFWVTSGQAVSGMSGGAIYDAQGRVVSVVSEGDEGGRGQLWGYPGLSDWVDCEMENRKTQVSFTPVVYGDE